jgi:heme/copper-type cytochrome/quinol oxidase subunit 3
MNTPDLSNPTAEAAEAAPRKVDVFEGLDPAVRERTKKMLMYFILFAVVMLFAGFTSAYIVSNVGQFWVHIEAPRALWISNALIVASSLPMWLSLRSMKQGNTTMSFVNLALTFALGIVFTVLQLQGWGALQDKGMGWTIDELSSGAKAYRWNSIEQLLDGPAQWGVDYTIGQDGTPLNYRPETNQLFGSDDVLMARDITLDVVRTSNSASGYLFILIVIHLFHLALGLAYLVVNGIRILNGTISPSDTVQLHTGGVYWHFLGLLWVYLFAFLFFFH